jgi:hypothetical protein
VEAVDAALFGPDEGYRGYSDWALGSLLSNGVDPAAVPPHMLTVVLELLVLTGRTVPTSQYVSSAEAAATHARRLNRNGATR